MSKGKKKLDYERPKVAQDLREQYADCLKALRSEFTYVESAKRRLNDVLRAYDRAASEDAKDKCVRDLMLAEDMVEELHREANQLRLCTDDLYELAARMRDTAQYFDKRVHSERRKSIGVVLRGKKSE